MDSNLTSPITILQCRLKLILEAISIGYTFNTEKYDPHYLKSAELYVELFSWYQEMCGHFACSEALAGKLTSKRRWSMPYKPVWKKNWRLHL